MPGNIPYRDYRSSPMSLRGHKYVPGRLDRVREFIFWFVLLLGPILLAKADLQAAFAKQNYLGFAGILVLAFSPFIFFFFAVKQVKKIDVISPDSEKPNLFQKPETENPNRAGSHQVVSRKYLQYWAMYAKNIKFRPDRFGLSLIFCGIAILILGTLSSLVFGRNSILGVVLLLVIGISLLIYLLSANDMVRISPIRSYKKYKIGFRRKNSSSNSSEGSPVNNNK
jgi:hypothetical protein